MSSRSQASGWYLHVQGIETGPSRIPFQYPCLCHLLTWVSAVEFSHAPNLYSWFVSSLRSPYSCRLPRWPRDIRKLTFLFVCLFWVNWSEDRQTEVPSAVLSWCTAARCFVQGLWYLTVFLLWGKRQPDSSFSAAFFPFVSAVSVVEPNIQPD